MWDYSAYWFKMAQIVFRKVAQKDRLHKILNVAKKQPDRIWKGLHLITKGGMRGSLLTVSLFTHAKGKGSEANVNQTGLELRFTSEASKKNREAVDIFGKE